MEDHIQYTENIVEIEGGNHAQFGNYCPQKGDLPAAISAEEQQAQTVEAIQSFLEEMGEKGLIPYGMTGKRAKVAVSLGRFLTVNLVY